MKTTLSLLLKILLCLVFAAVAFFWATGLIDSLYAFRSPLHSDPPPDSAPTRLNGEPALTRKVVYVLVDALRLDTAMNSQVMPFLGELRQQGAWATMHSRPPSYSAPAYSVLMTGAWPELSDGPAMNLEYEELTPWTQGNLFTVFQAANLRSAASGFNWFEKLIPAGTLSASFFTAGEDQSADREVVDAALPWLQNSNIQFILIHLDQVDYAGHHEGGPQSSNWAAAAGRVDDLLREITSSLDLQQDTLLLSSDHGQIDRGGHGGQDQITLLEPFLLVGAGIRPGVYPDIQMVDVAPTIAALLGAGLPGSTQGQALIAMLDLPPGETQPLISATIQQQAALLTAYRNAIGEPQGSSLSATSTVDQAVNEAQEDLEAARQARLNRERMWRIPLALLTLLMPAFWIIRYQRGSILRMLLGSAFYLVVFHIRYGILDHRTYSLSSVASSGEIITYAALNTLLALFIAWLFIAWRSEIFRQAPRNAAMITLNFILVNIFIISLPLIWNYWLNGAFIDWTLPDFTAMFLGFLALLQILVVAVVGLLLSGISALLARLLQKRKHAPTPISPVGI